MSQKMYALSLVYSYNFNEPVKSFKIYKYAQQKKRFTVDFLNNNDPL